MIKVQEAIAKDLGSHRDWYFEMSTNSPSYVSHLFLYVVLQSVFVGPSIPIHSLPYALMYRQPFSLISCVFQ